MTDEERKAAEEQAAAEKARAEAASAAGAELAREKAAKEAAAKAERPVTMADLHDLERDYRAEVAKVRGEVGRGAKPADGSSGAGWVALAVVIVLGVAAAIWHRAKGTP